MNANARTGDKDHIAAFGGVKKIVLDERVSYVVRLPLRCLQRVCANCLKEFADIA